MGLFITSWKEQGGTRCCDVWSGAWSRQTRPAWHLCQSRLAQPCTARHRCGGAIPASSSNSQSGGWMGTSPGNLPPPPACSPDGQGKGIPATERRELPGDGGTIVPYLREQGWRMHGGKSAWPGWDFNPWPPNPIHPPASPQGRVTRARAWTGRHSRLRPRRKHSA